MLKGRFEKIKEEDKLNLAQDLRLLLQSGIPIQEALETLITQAGPGPYRSFLIGAKIRIEKGSSFYSICAGNRHFDPVFVNFIKVGEETGNLPQALKFLSDWLNNRLALKKEISSVTLYPKILIIFALVVGFGLSIFILPGVVGVIKSLNAEPFIITRILLALSDFMKKYGIYFAVGIIFLVIFSKIFKSPPFIKKRIDWLILRIPAIGSLYRDYQLAIISQIGFTLYSSGIPASQIFRIIADSSSNFYYHKSMLRITESIEKGTTPSVAMKAFPKLYPGTFISVMAVGEKAGTLEQSFSYLAGFFQTRLFRKTKNLPTIIEPVLLLIIGLFIVFMALGIIVPIYEVSRGI